MSIRIRCSWPRAPNTGACVTSPPIPLPYPIDSPSTDALLVALAAWSAGRLRWDIPVGETFWRVLRAPSAALAEEFARVCYPSPALTRFAPIARAGNVLASAYSGSSLDVALSEVVLRDVRHSGVRRVPTHEVTNRYAVQVASSVPLAVVDARRPKDVNLAVAGQRAPDLSAAWPQAYSRTRAWAQALSDDLPGMEGLCYESHQLAGHCIVIYQPDDRSVFDLLGPAQPVGGGESRTRLTELAAASGAVVDFGDVDDD